MLFQQIAIDVWGNARDGYEVNDEVATSFFVDIDLDEMNDAEIIKAVRSNLGHRADARGYTVKADEFGIKIYRKSDGKPAYFLRPATPRDWLGDKGGHS